jgi:hypothetical protein
MGLAQLLKLFELWQKRSSQISVINTNRMIGILFKMTGLTRYLTEEPAKAEPVAAEEQPPLPSEQTSPSPIASNPLLLEGLQILPPPSGTMLNQQFNLNGIIDVSAVETLETLYVIPQGASDAQLCSNPARQLHGASAIA